MAPEQTLKSWDNPKLLFALAVATANDTKPKGVIAPAYLVANNKGLEETITRAGSELYKSGRASFLLVDAVPEGYFDHYPNTTLWWAGHEEFRDLLKKDNVPSVDIRSLENPPADVPGGKPPLIHTASEAEEIVKLAEREKWTDFFVVAHPMHMLRAFALVVTFLVLRRLSVRVYAHTGPQVSGWCSEAIFNQDGRTGMILCDGTDGELARLRKIYGNRFDICPAETVIAYLKWRDSNGKFPFPANPFRVE